MKKRRKIVAPLVVLLMISSLLAGCAKSNNVVNETTPPAPSTGQEAAGTTEPVKEALPSELIVSSFNWGWPTVDEAQDRIGPELEKALGFKVKLNVLKAGSSDEADKKLQLWAATKAADMPDILMTTSSTLAAQTIDSLGRNGVLLDWNEILDRMPTYKAQVSQLLPISTDVESGKQFRVPQNFESPKGTKPAANPLIRKDWLDQLGLPVPKTTDELRNTLIAFRDKIKLPDGQKVIPSVDFGEMFWTNKYMFNNPEYSYAGSGNITVGLNDWFTDKKDGKVKRHDMEFSDNVYEFLAYYNSLYKEGLLDKESFTLKYGQYLEKVSSGRVGVFGTWGTHVMTVNDTLATVDPKALFVGTTVFDSKTNPTLDPTFTKKALLGVNSYWIIKKSISEEQLNAFIKYMEYTMGEEGWKLTNFGQEGKDWKYDADNKIVETQEAADKFKGNLGAKIPEGIWYYSPTPNYDLKVKYDAPTAYDKRPDVIETLKNMGYVQGDEVYSYITDKAPYVLPGPIEMKKGAGYVTRWKDMVVSGVMAKTEDDIKQIIAKWQETERKLGYDEISEERTNNLKTVPDLEVK
ncbi:hypothetical protein Back11_28890 [Paenibacillus baekrokdamisoli]|uniref:Uncharacterized protein n=1 Tax=Paenibacillus baekrokdamisoli TaxID=1712516 RepID=A0A3G9JEC1_9BACL|nr:hypothetical protein [Paenibacillus baekrokdamisoli]MBB3071126.1 ABC-type glycerol-3-phosphate transport system substrate-binding protein [Paenibacillus baekrokdamisoli]BBH21544.1 hypothetical protein Back11_28890 [Paenibacillus baekrokdamisoli]